jgi:hypothetical protein
MIPSRLKASKNQLRKHGVDILNEILDNERQPKLCVIHQPLSPLSHTFWESYIVNISYWETLLKLRNSSVQLFFISQKSMFATVSIFPVE